MGDGVSAGSLPPVSLIGGVFTSLMQMTVILAHGNPGVAVALDQFLRRWHRPRQHDRVVTLLPLALTRPTQHRS